MSKISEKPKTYHIWLSSVYVLVLNTILVTGIAIWAPFIIDQYKNDHAFNWKINAFITANVIFILSFFLSQRSQQKINDYNQSKILVETELLKTESSSLRKTVTTLPPEHFLSTFSKIYKEGHTVYLAVKENVVTEKECEFYIRSMLSAILTLTKIFDRQKDQSILSANVMTLVESYKTNDKILALIEETITFHDENTDLKKLKGALLLQNQLTASTSVQNGSPDPDMKDVRLSFPVPMQANNLTTNKFEVLPGAPHTALMNSPGAFPNTVDLKQWMEQYGNFKESVCQTVGAYFQNGAGKNMKSFISIPLHDGSEDDHSSAVLNIHCNNYMFENNEKWDMYLNIMSPFFILTADLIAHWRTL